MKIETSKGKTYAAKWIGGPTTITREIYCEIDDTRPIYEIAKEFDGAELTEKRESGEKTVYAGYTELASISRDADTNYVRIALRKPMEE